MSVRIDLRRFLMQVRKLIEFLDILKNMKSNTRHVWVEDGRQESVADHSWRLAVMALLIADEFEGVDINKVVKMCLIHDFGEAITGDIPSFFKTESDSAKEDLAVVDMLKKLPKRLGDEFSALFLEMDERKTLEAKFFKALDGIEACITHNESPLDTWLELEYTENLVYGTENAAFSEYLKELREEVRLDSVRKIESGV
jgi:putative hydrolase of HD superfamily